MSANQAMLERELGHFILTLMKNVDIMGLAAPAAERRALAALQAIQAVLDDPGHSDFECVEEIVSILAQTGIPTDRHDFG